MSRRQKVILAVVAAVVALLYVVVVLNQGRSGQGSPTGPPGGLVERLDSWLGDTAAAAPEDLTISCVRPDGALGFDGRCTVEVAPSESRLRLVRLCAADPVGITAPAPVGDFTVRAELDAGEPTRIAVGPDGAEIVLRCLADDECVVAIGTEAGDG